MTHYHYFIDGICENCGERKIDIDIESAERAIVEAADKWQRTRDDLGAEFEGDSELAAAVDAWRKLKGKR